VSAGPRPSSGNTRLRPGDVVEVRSAEEILATLDETGSLDGMPFMPEMLRFCGQTLSVYRRADKTCDTIYSSGLRRLQDTVFLADLRCDGSAHGGCQAGCLLYWNERWLSQPTGEAAVARPSAGDAEVGASAGEARDVAAERPPGHAAPGEDDLYRLTQGPSEEGTPERFVCQATELLAASSPLPWWEPTQYVRDVRSGNATPRQVVTSLYRWLLVRIQARVNGSGIPFVKGRLTKTPRQVLDLQPGERVRIKSRDEIEATLDVNNRNRGLRVDPDQLLFCGGEFRVLRRVNRIIDERTGRMIQIPGDCIVLDGTTCTGTYNRCCPRSDNPYWREIWLARVDDQAVLANEAPALLP
jgi:hypothetical protein